MTFKLDNTQKQTNGQTSSHIDKMADDISSRFVGINIFHVVMYILAALIIWSSLITAQQIQKYHQDYKALQDMKDQYRQLQIEHQRLLIEQQTFSSTPQIAARAVSELKMYSPSLEDKMVIQPQAPVSNNSSANGE